MRPSIAWREHQPSVRSLDSIVNTFDEGWGRPGWGLLEFWKRWGAHRPLVELSALIKVDLRRRFERGERPAASAYLAQFPELAEDGDRVLSLVYEEYCLLDENQANPSLADFCRRYDRWKDSIASQLGHHHRFSQVVGAARPEILYPAIGDRFASYQLRSVLGDGGTARVYLATDGELGGREVVLKLTPTLGLEPSILASLQHRNIVPIHSVARPEGSTLQGICMPYRPGITLEQLLEELLAAGMPRRARLIWDLLRLDELDRNEADLAWRDFPIGGTYIEGVAWLGLEMAQALAYLHGRGVYHRDVKPANILLSARGGPLLIDFNLAHSPHTPEQAREAMSGGTLPYMAPEQLQAFLDPGAWDRVGPKADIYALGLVLRELVTGVRPALPSRALPLDRAIADLRDLRSGYAASSRDLRPDLPPSLDAIIRKCLAFDPDARYAAAQELADDLRRFLQRKPLTGAINPSPVERVLNWGYRQRQVASILLLMGVVLGSNLLPNLYQPRPDLKLVAPPPAHRASRVIPSLGASPAPRLRSPLLPAPPARRAAAVPYDALGDPTFRAIIHTLQSTPSLVSNPSPDDPDEGFSPEWAEASRALRVLMARLKAQGTESAWPLVYLVQIEQRRPRPSDSKNRIRRDTEKGRLDKGRLQTAIEQMPDAEAASLHCLTWAPDPVPPLITLGALATARADFNQARLYFNEALLHQEEHFGVKHLLATMAYCQGRSDEAIEQYTDLLNSRKIPTTTAFESRRDLIQVVLQRLDDLLEAPTVTGAAGEARACRVRSLVDLAHTQIHAFREDIENLSDKNNKVRYPYFGDLAAASLASAQAWIAGLNQDADGAEAQFREARRHLDLARERARAMPEEREQTNRMGPSRREILGYLDSQGELLDRRAALCGLAGALAPPAPRSPDRPQ